MRKAGAVLILSTGLTLAVVAPAHAAPTRAEYIGSVDPTCQSVTGPMGSNWGALHRGFKRMNRGAKSGKTKLFIRGAKQIFRALNGLSQTRTGMIDQIAAVQAPDADASLIATWLGYLRQEAQFEVQAASALGRLRMGKFFLKLRRADNAEDAAKAVIAGFGFQVCGTFPAV